MQWLFALLSIDFETESAELKWKTVYIYVDATICADGVGWTNDYCTLICWNEATEIDRVYCLCGYSLYATLVGCCMYWLWVWTIKCNGGDIGNQFISAMLHSHPHTVFVCSIAVQMDFICNTISCEHSSSLLAGAVRIRFTWNSYSYEQYYRSPSNLTIDSNFTCENAF